MAATMEFYLDTGGSDTSPANEDSIDLLGPPNLRFKSADDKTIDLNDPIVIPGSGTTYSFWKSIYLLMVAPDSNEVDNLRFYSDGANGLGTGLDVNIGLQFPSNTDDASAGYVVAGVSTGMVVGHGGISTEASVFDYTTPGSELAITIGEAGNLMDAANETSNYMILEMQVEDTAGPGTSNQETLGIKYDEQ